MLDRIEDSELRMETNPGWNFGALNEAVHIWYTLGDQVSLEYLVLWEIVGKSRILIICCLFLGGFG